MLVSLSFMQDLHGCRTCTIARHAAQIEDLHGCSTCMDTVPAFYLNMLGTVACLSLSVSDLYDLLGYKTCMDAGPTSIKDLHECKTCCTDEAVRLIYG